MNTLPLSSYSGALCASCGDVAGATSAFALCDRRPNKVFSGQQMPSGAMRLSRARCRQCVTSQRILAGCDGAAVVRIAATPSAVVADVVVEMHPRRYGANLPLVADPIEVAHPTVDADQPVAAGVAAMPNVTAIGVRDPSRRVLPFRPRYELHTHNLATKPCRS